VRVWAQPLPFAAVEAVEVVKGPASVLYGRNEPGGIINVVTVKPQFTPVASIAQTFGSFDSYVTRADFGDALNASKTLAGRITAAYSDSGSFRERTFDRLLDVNLGLAWQPSSSTRIDLGIDYTRDKYQPDFGLPALGDKPAPVPVTRSYKQDYIDSDTEATIVTLGLEQRLAEGWQLRANLFGSYQKPEYFNVYGYGLNETTLQYPVIYFAEQFSYRRTYQSSLDLTGHFDTFGLKHTLLVGLDHDRETYDGPIFFSDAAPPLDLYNPQIGTAPRTYPTRADYSPYGSVQRWTGEYLQDQIAIGERLIVNLGFRNDHASYAFSPDPRADLVTTNALKPRAGLVFKARPGLSLFAQYQEGFAPANGRSSSGQAFPSQTATEVQVGGKWANADDTLLATIVLFDLRKKNLVTGDPSTPDPNDSIAVGEVRNRGIEFDAAGQLTRQLSLIASYAYSDARQTKDNNGNQGERYNGVAYNSGSLWARWQFDPAFAAGLGLYAEGNRAGDLANSYSVPGYARLDAMAQYRFRLGPARLSAQLNVNNLLDQKYYAGIYGNARDFIQPGTTRQFIGSLRADF